MAMSTEEWIDELKGISVLELSDTCSATNDVSSMGRTSTTGFPDSMRETSRRSVIRRSSRLVWFNMIR